MDEDADVYYVDTRNAAPVVVSRSQNQPGRVVYTPGPRTTMTVPRMPYGQAPLMYGSAGAPVMYGTAGGALGSLFGGMTSGQVIELIGQGFAALQSLPTPPTTTGDTATDIGNLGLYQTALANHAKSDERIRTLASLAARLLGA
jgi:hypothetical protein